MINALETALLSLIAAAARPTTMAGRIARIEVQIELIQRARRRQA